MKLSAQFRYGLRAMIELARVHGRGPVKRKEIALSQSLSEAYIENILILLKRGGLIRAVRGARGGFELALPPRQINILDIAGILEGSLLPVDCLENGEYCKRSGACPARSVWKKLHDAQRNALSAISLADLLQMGATEGMALLYHI